MKGIKFVLAVVFMILLNITTVSAYHQTNRFGRFDDEFPREHRIYISSRFNDDLRDRVIFLQDSRLRFRNRIFERDRILRSRFSPRSFNEIVIVNARDGRDDVDNIIIVTRRVSIIIVNRDCCRIIDRGFPRRRFI